MPFDAATLSTYDAALIVTDHDNVAYAKLLEHIGLVVDTRNVIGRLQLEGGSTKVAKA